MSIIQPSPAGTAVEKQEGPLDRLLYLHIPKTAGTSFSYALSLRWPRMRVLAGSRELATLLAEGTAPDYDLLTGHFYAFEIESPLLAAYRPVTVLRNPFDRLLSSYRFQRQANALGLVVTPGVDFAMRVPFSEYVFSALGANDRHAQLLFLGLGNLEEAPVTPLCSLLERAKQRLARMRVGISDQLQPFLDRLLVDAGRGGEPLALEHLRSHAPTGPRDAAGVDGGLTRQQRAVLDDILRPDYALYDYAKRLMFEGMEARSSRSGRPAATPVALPPAPSVSQDLIPMTDLIDRLKSMSGPMEHLQKLCDAADWADPRLLAVVREALHMAPRINPRLWEFCVAYLGLARAGKLDGNSHGITFGSGQEALIYAVAPRAASLLVTDLYSLDSSWDIARTVNPRDFVLAAAPLGFDASRLDARSMDMRRIDVPDSSFDFCYSISAFEHIGDDPDFLDHLREVRRILKPGGVYALTTEVRIAAQSNPTTGNYCFAVDHLLRLFREAGLHPEPVVDMRLSDFSENDPRDLNLMRHHDGADYMMTSLVVREFGGIMSAPVMFLLRAEPGVVPNVLGLDQTIARCEQSLAHRNRLRHADWMRLNPWGLSGTGRSDYCDLYAGGDAPLPENPLVFATGYTTFGTGTLEVQVVLTPSPECQGIAPVALAVNGWEREDNTALAACYHYTGMLNETPGHPLVHRFRIPVSASRRYSILGARGPQRVLLAAADVQVRLLPAE